MMDKLKSFVRRLASLSAKGKGIDPSRDWLIVIGLSLVAVIASVAWNVSFFYSALRDEAAPDASALIDASKESALPALRAEFERRANEAARYGETSFVDPSR